jgi:uncharacterized membrane protein
VQKPLALALTVGACLWTVVLVATPYAAASRNHVLVAAAAFVYQGAGLICHQRPERSFHLAGVQVPVCGRCLGLYVSGALGALAAWIAAARVPRRARLALGVAAIPTAATLGLELAGLAQPGNWGRALSALPLGGAAAWIFVVSLRAEAEPAVPRDSYARTQSS